MTNMKSADKSRLSALIGAEELNQILHQKDVKVFDARQGKEAHESYLKGHIEGAIWVNLETDLASPENAKNGGRHPLPTRNSFQQTLGVLGIDANTHVVIYDTSNAAIASARFWWMLRAIGHERVQVLNGGLGAAEAAGLPIRAGTEKASPSKDYPLTEWQLPLASLESVKKLSGEHRALIIDVRSQDRYLGLVEPIDPVAGHIPTAVNIPFIENLEDSGLFLSPTALRNKYLPLLNQYPDHEKIVHCGSGVTACHTLLALDYAEIPLPKLYVGSWSEWCRNEIIE